jgi:hypothetical protein
MASPDPQPDDDLDVYAAQLVAAVTAAMPRWTVSHVERLLTAWTGTVTATQLAEAAAAGDAAATWVDVELRAFARQDIDAQRTNPLAIIRRAVRFPAEVLTRHGVPAVQRDEFAERTMPDDIYDLSPATWRDLGEDVHEAGIIWGAWKAKQHLDRHGHKRTATTSDE